MSGPLKGIRVLDLTRILSGPFATMILGDLGADVIKVEHPSGGDGTRGNGPFLADGYSSYFLSINRSKRSITLDLARPKGKQILLELVKQSDVLIENFVPGTMARFGLDYPVVEKINPAIIYASITGFGQTGPYAQKPALDIVIQGMGGIMSITGEPDGGPVRVGASVGDIVASLYCVIGILAALQERATSGRGQMLDLSMLECLVAIEENAFARYFATGEVPGRLGTRHPSYTPFQAFETKDSWIVVATIGAEQWALLCAAIERVDLIDDARCANGWLRSQHYQEMEPILSDVMRRKTTREWLEELSALNVPCGPVNSIADVVKDPHVVYRGAITEVQHPVLGGLKTVDSPLRLSRTSASVGQPAPDLGQHTEEVLTGLLGITPHELEVLRQEKVL
ncbi:MAG: CaiB/BaiF CoA-transferase family protein [Chloroflexota bacterium]